MKTFIKHVSCRPGYFELSTAKYFCLFEFNYTLTYPLHLENPYNYDVLLEQNCMYVCMYVSIHLFIHSFILVLLAYVRLILNMDGYHV